VVETVRTIIDARRSKRTFSATDVVFAAGTLGTRSSSTP